MAPIFLDLSKYQGTLTGTWADTTATGGSGKWTIDGTNYQGLYRTSLLGDTIDVYTDFNKNGTIDAVDKRVGLATFATSVTGGRGTWNWTVTGRSGDYFGSNGQDVGNVAIDNLSFLTTGIKLDAVLGILFSSAPKEGAGVFTTSISLSAGTPGLIQSLSMGLVVADAAPSPAAP